MSHIDLFVELQTSEYLIVPHIWPSSCGMNAQLQFQNFSLQPIFKIEQQKTLSFALCRSPDMLNMHQNSLISDDIQQHCMRIRCNAAGLIYVFSLSKHHAQLRNCCKAKLYGLDDNLRQAKLVFSVSFSQIHSVVSQTHKRSRRPVHAFMLLSFILFDVVSYVFLFFCVCLSATVSVLPME